MLPVLHRYLLLSKVQLMDTNPWSLKKVCNKQSLWSKVVVTCTQPSTWARLPLLAAASMSPAERVMWGCLSWTCWGGLEKKH